MVVQVQGSVHTGRRWLASTTTQPFHSSTALLVEERGGETFCGISTIVEERRGNLCGACGTSVRGGETFVAHVMKVG